MAWLSFSDLLPILGALLAGGVIGYFVVGQWHAAFPYLLVVAASSFVYVALADLMPQLQRRLPWRETVAQIAWIGAGLAIVVLLATLAPCRAATSAAAPACTSTTYFRRTPGWRTRLPA